MLCYLFSFYLPAWSSPTQRIALHHLLCCIFENLRWLFAARICCRYLPWEFTAGICRGFFVYTSESFFVYVSKSCLYGGKPFLYVCKTFLFVRFSLLTVLLLVIVVAVMGHRNFVMKHLYNELLHYSMQMQKSIVTF